MKTRSLILTIVLAFIATAASAAEVAVIANPGNPVAVLSEQDAKNIYLGKKTTWSDGTPVVIYTQANPAVTEAFAQAVLKKSAQQFELHWRKALFTGQGTPPQEVKDSEQMKKQVAAQRGAIGYVLAAEVDGSVKRLSVQ
jgi:ABC-type phosphate transport system substrate-binding protein